MKTISYIILIAVLSCNIFAQKVETVTVDISKLSPEARAEIESRKNVEKIKQYGEWVGLGKEIGIAVDSSLASVTDRAAQFADTDMGKVTMAVLVYKIIGRDVVRIVVGCSLLTITTLFTIIFCYLNCVRAPKYKEEYILEDGKKKGVKMQYGNPVHEGVMFLYFIVFAVSCAFCSLLMFA